MSLNPKRLTRSSTYRIDGLDTGSTNEGWTFAGHTGGIATFHSPNREQIVLPVERLYEVTPGHLHYVSSG